MTIVLPILTWIYNFKVTILHSKHQEKDETLTYRWVRRLQFCWKRNETAREILKLVKTLTMICKSDFDRFWNFSELNERTFRADKTFAFAQLSVESVHVSPVTLCCIFRAKHRAVCFFYEGNFAQN